MRRTYGPSPDEVIARRIGTAAAVRKVTVPDTESWAKFATLPAGELTAADRYWGRKGVQRYLRRHGGDRDALRELIEVLGVGGEEG